MQNFKALDLAAEFYRATKHVPMAPHLKAQFLRASSSIALNLGEGNGKISFKEKRRFYQIAMGSLRECQTILKLEGFQEPKVIEMADHLGGSIFKLCRSIKDRES